jgi:hypothetical protein
LSAKTIYGNQPAGSLLFVSLILGYICCHPEGRNG